jgi:hypothetical protein
MSTLPERLQPYRGRRTAPELARLMGVTRAHALNLLKQYGVKTPVTVQTGEPGKPAHVYRLA